MAMLKLYKATMKSIQYVTPNGGSVEFVDGRYATDDVGICALLDAEIKGRHPHIYRDPKELEVDSERMDPIAEIKRKAVEDYVASQAAANNKNNDRGTYVPGNPVMTNSHDVAAASAAPEAATQEAPAVKSPVGAIAGSIAAKLAAAKAAQEAAPSVE